MTRFTRNLRWAMCDRGLSAAMLAESFPLDWGPHLSARTTRIRHYVRGDQDPKLPVVEMFADALDVPPEVLAFGNLREWTNAVR